MQMSRLTRDRTAEPLLRDQILRRERKRGNIIFPYSVDHVQDYWQPYPVDPHSCYMCDYTLTTCRIIGNLTRLIHTLATCVTIHRLSLELCRCSSDLFLSSRPRTGVATT